MGITVATRYNPQHTKALLEHEGRDDGRTEKDYPSAVCNLLCATGHTVEAQRRSDDARKPVRTVTIPITVRPKDSRAARELQTIEVLQVLEDDVPQEILAKRGGTSVPLTLAILIQDDLVSSIANEINGLAQFIRRLPPNSRVLVGYLRSGSLQVRQRFTPDLERAARALRIPISSPTSAPYNPYVQTLEALKRFESQPTGSRRAILLISDGLDVSRGVSSATPSQSLDLQRHHDAQLAASRATLLPPTTGHLVGSFGAPSYGQARGKTVERDGGARLLSRHLGAGQLRSVPARPQHAASEAVRADLPFDQHRQRFSPYQDRFRTGRRRDTSPGGLHPLKSPRRRAEIL